MISAKLPSVLAIVIAFGAMLLSAPLHAQMVAVPGSNSRIEREMEPVDPDEIRRVVKYFGNCIYRREPEMAEAFLLYSDHESIGFSRMGIAAGDLNDELDMSHCLRRAMDVFSITSELRMTPVTLRSHLAEASYLANSDTPPVLLANDVEVLPNRYFGVNASDRTRYRAAFSDCIVYHAPIESDLLIRTDPTSDEEAAAVQSLIPALSSCLTEGQNLELTITTIRGLVADGLWARNALSDDARSGTNE